MLHQLPFVYTFALMLSLGASPLRAVDDAEVQNNQSHAVLHGFIEKAKLGGSADDAFLKLDDVKGTATDTAHKDQIEVFFARNFISSVSSTTSTPHPTPSLYYLVIKADKSYPILEQAAASGKPFVKAEIFFREAVSGEQKVHSVDTLEDVRVVYFARTSAPVPGNSRVVIIGLSFGRATWTQGSTKAGRDFVGNKNT